MVLASGIELGRVSRLPLCVFMPSAGIASSTTTTVASSQRDERVLHDGAEHPAADGARTHPAEHAVQQRDPRAVHPAAELGQQRRQHGDRAEHGDRDDDDRADGERVERRVADQEQPGHRADHGRAGHQDRVARGLGRDLDGVAGGVALGPLLALALEVEQRVVDADGHADQHDHAGHGGVGVDQVRDRSQDADRGGHAGAGEQHRDAGRDQGAEGEQHQDQRHRQAERLGRGEVVGDPVVDRLVEADVAGLADVELREVGLHGLRSRPAGRRRRPGHGRAGSRRGTPYRPG